MPKMGPMLLKCGPQSRSGHIEFTKEKAFGVEGNCSFLLKKKIKAISKIEYYPVSHKGKTQTETRGDFFFTGLLLLTL